MMFSVTVSGGTSMKCWCTMPMPWAMASCGLTILTGWPLTVILPLVRLVEAVEDVHQRGLARAIFTQERVDLPLLQGEINVIVGKHARKAFGDAGGLEGWGHSVLLGRLRDWVLGIWAACSIPNTQYPYPRYNKGCCTPGWNTAPFGPHIAGRGGFRVEEACVRHGNPPLQLTACSRSRVLPLFRSSVACLILSFTVCGILLSQSW